MAGEAGQGKLLGIYRYISEHEAWNLRILESTHELTPNVISDALRNGYDGFIVSMIATTRRKASRSTTSCAT